MTLLTFFFCPVLITGQAQYRKTRSRGEPRDPTIHLRRAGQSPSHRRCRPAKSMAVWYRHGNLRALPEILAGSELLDTRFRRLRGLLVQEGGRRSDDHRVRQKISVDCIRLTSSQLWTTTADIQHRFQTKPRLRCPASKPHSPFVLRKIDPFGTGTTNHLRSDSRYSSRVD